MDALPTRDGRTVEHFTVFKRFLINCVGGHGEVLLLTARVREPIIDELHVFLLNQLQDFCD